MRYEQNHILPQKTGTRVYGIVKGFQKVYLLKPLIFTLFYHQKLHNSIVFFKFYNCIIKKHKIQRLPQVSRLRHFAVCTKNTENILEKEREKGIMSEKV